MWQKPQHERQREGRLAPAAAHVLQCALDRDCDLGADGDAVLPDEGTDKGRLHARGVGREGPGRALFAEHVRDLCRDGQGIVV